MCNQRHKLNKTAHLFDHYLVLIIHKINTVKNIYAFVKYSVSVLGKNGLKYSVFGKIWYSVQPYQSSSSSVQFNALVLNHCILLVLALSAISNATKPCD